MGWLLPAGKCLAVSLPVVLSLAAVRGGLGCLATIFVLYRACSAIVCCMLRHAVCCKRADLPNDLQAVPKIPYWTTISKLADAQLHLCGCHAAAAPEKQCKNRI